MLEAIIIKVMINVIEEVMAEGEISLTEAEDAVTKFLPKILANMVLSEIQDSKDRQKTRLEFPAQFEH